MNRCNNCRVEEIGDGSKLLKNDFAADKITVCNKKKTGSKGIKYESSAGVSIEYVGSVLKERMNYHASPGTSASILLTFANPGFPAEIVLNSTATDFTGTEQFVNSLNKNASMFLKTVKIIRILGLMALISYMIVILFTWISANMGGFVYFSAGEPELTIKYPEWVLGFLGIIVAADYLQKELNGDN